MDSFYVSNGIVYEPQNKMLRSFYEALKKHAPSLGGSRAFEDLIDAYEALEYDMREEIQDESTIRAV